MPRLATWVSRVWMRLGSQFYALNFVGLELLLTNGFYLAGFPSPGSMAREVLLSVLLAFPG